MMAKWHTLLVDFGAGSGERQADVLGQADFSYAVLRVFLPMRIFAAAAALSGGVHQQTGRGAVSLSGVEAAPLGGLPDMGKVGQGRCRSFTHCENAHCWLLFSIWDLSAPLGTDALANQWGPFFMHFPLWTSSVG